MPFLVSAHEKTVKGRLGQTTTQDPGLYAAPSMSQCLNQGWLQTGGMAWLGALRCAMSLPFCLMDSGFLLLPASCPMRMLLCCLAMEGPNHWSSCSTDVAFRSCCTALQTNGPLRCCAVQTMLQAPPDQGVPIILTAATEELRTTGHGRGTHAQALRPCHSPLACQAACMA